MATPGARRPTRWALAACLALSACGGPSGHRDRDAGPGSGDPPAPAGPGAPPAAAAPDTAVRQPSYRAVPIPDGRALDRLRRELGPERFLLTLKVNRRDSLHVRHGDSLMVPDSAASHLDLAPFPRELPSAADLAQLVLVSRRVQAFAAYDRGRLAYWGPVSTGRESLPTPEGLYHANWKDRERTSTFNDEWLLRWYVNLENFLGISFHQFDMPGYPASHSCIRLFEDDAIWLYGWVSTWKLDARQRTVLEHGTPVVVFGRFAHGRKSPWRKLAADSTATNVPLGEIEAALDRFLRPGRAGPADSLRAATPEAMNRAPGDTSGP